MKQVLQLWNIVSCRSYNKTGEKRYIVTTDSQTVSINSLKTSMLSDYSFVVIAKHTIPIGKVYILTSYGTVESYKYEPEYRPTELELKNLFLKVHFTEGPKWLIYNDEVWLCKLISLGTKSWSIVIQHPQHCTIKISYDYADIRHLHGYIPVS